MTLLRALVLGGALVLAGCGDGPCETAIVPLASLRPDTIKSAPPEMLAPWKKQLDAARATCSAEGKSDALERIRDVDLAITMRSADFTIEAGARAEKKVAAVASNRVAVPTSWPVTCSDVAREGAFTGLLPSGIPREVAGHLVAAPPMEDAGTARPGGGPPDESLVLAGRAVYLSARGGKLEGSIFQDGAFKVQQQLAWPAEAAAEGGTIDRIVAAKGPDGLGVAWVANLSVYFALLDVGTESWSAFGEIPVSGDDGGRDLTLGDLAWGRASFGLVLGTEKGFAFVEILPTARAVRPAALQPAFIAGRPRIAWDGARFVVAAGRDDRTPSMGFWRAPDGSYPAEWMPLVDVLPQGGVLAPLDGELLSREGSIHLAFRVSRGDTASLHVGHALPGGPSAVETCP